MNSSSSGSAGYARVRERRPPLEQHRLGVLEHAPDRADGRDEVLDGPILGGDRALPVPLVDVGGVVVVEEVVLADGAHVGQEPLARPHAELGEREPLPLRRRLHDLGVDRVQVAVVRDVERDRRPRAVAVEVVVDAALAVDDQRHLDERQVQLLAQAVLDQSLRRVQRPHPLTRLEQRLVVVRQHELELAVVADPRPCEVRFLDGTHRRLLRS